MNPPSQPSDSREHARVGGQVPMQARFGAPDVGEQIELEPQLPRDGRPVFASAEMDSCVEAVESSNEEVEELDKLQGNARMEVLLNPEGQRPLGVNGQLVDGSPEDPQLLACLRQATAAAPYPKYDGPPVVVEFDFELDVGSEIEDE